MKTVTAHPKNCDRVTGFTIIEIMIVLAAIGLLATIAIPNFMKSRDRAQLNSVYNNLRVIESAKDQWALENKTGTGAATDWPALQSYLKGGTVKSVVQEDYVTSPIGSPPYASSPVRLGTYAPGDQITAQ